MSGITVARRFLPVLARPLLPLRGPRRPEPEPP